VLVFVGTGSIIFGITGAAYVPGGAAIAAVAALGAALGAIIPASRGLREIAVNGQTGAALGRVTIRVAAVAVVAGVVFALMQAGIVPLVRLGG